MRNPVVFCGERLASGHAQCGKAFNISIIFCSKTTRPIEELAGAGPLIEGLMTTSSLLGSYSNTNPIGFIVKSIARMYTGHPLLPGFTGISIRTRDWIESTSEIIPC